MSHEHGWKETSWIHGINWCNICGTIKEERWKFGTRRMYFKYNKPKVMKWYGRSIEKQLSTLDRGIQYSD